MACVAVAAEADFTSDEARMMFGEPRDRDLAPSMGNATKYWQLASNKRTFNFVLIADYPDEVYPTIYCTNKEMFREFLDYVEEGLTVIRYIGSGT